MRLFQGDPVWTAWNRSPEVDKKEARVKYQIFVEANK